MGRLFSFGRWLAKINDIIYKLQPKRHLRISEKFTQNIEQYTRWEKLQKLSKIIIFRISFIPHFKEYMNCYYYDSNVWSIQARVTNGDYRHRYEVVRFFIHPSCSSSLTSFPENKYPPTDFSPESSTYTPRSRFSKFCERYFINDPKEKIQSHFWEIHPEYWATHKRR